MTSDQLLNHWPAAAGLDPAVLNTRIGTILVVRRETECCITIIGAKHFVNLVFAPPKGTDPVSQLTLNCNFTSEFGLKLEFSESHRPESIGRLLKTIHDLNLDHWTFSPSEPQLWFRRACVWTYTILAEVLSRGEGNDLVCPGNDDDGPLEVACFHLLQQRSPEDSAHNH